MRLLDIFRKKPVDVDKAVLDRLAKVGSQLAQPHNVDFFFFFLSEEAAGPLLTRLQSEGFAVRSAKAKAANTWCLEAQKTMIPNLESLHSIRAMYGQLATQTGGVYDGWGSSVVS